MNGVQTYRNPGLVNILNKLGYIEYFGSGIPRIINSYANSSYKPVLFKPSENFFSLLLPNLNSMVDPINDSIKIPLNDFDLLLLKTISENPGLNTKRLLEIIIIKDSSATLDRIKNSLKRNLTELCEFRGSKNTGGYYIITHQ